MRLAVASGKGGTGKTLVATNLGAQLAAAGARVTYVDTDVEAPNGHLFLRPTWTEERRFTVPVPQLRTDTCSGCGECQRACAFNAIIALPDRILPFPQLCHACGGCVIACPEAALVETPREIGTLRRGARDRLRVWEGALDIGEAMAPPLIRGLLSSVAEETRGEGLVILDAPPGTACSAVTVLEQADLVLLVTEPTPFGRHDLELAVETARAVGRPSVAVINRADLGDDGVRTWLTARGIPVWAEIPFSPEVAAAYARGELAAQASPELAGALGAITDHLKAEAA